MSNLALFLTLFVMISGATVLVFIATFAAQLAASGIEKAHAARAKEADRAATLRGRIANRLRRTTA